VASGGELSRVMLAIKSVMGGDRGKTMVFDEIDAGIGGRVAELVGRRLKNLGAGSQIICVTHLPQIAAYGDCHFVVEKYQGDDSTSARIRRLTEKERVEEIARMLGGLTITEKTVARAEEMLRHAQESAH
jgi:DNA repair protein RecN (Recombination protein N)